MNSLHIPFAEKLKQLVAAFESEERPDEKDAEVADAMLEFVLKYERLRRQVTDGSDEANAVDAETIAKMKSWDSNDPTMSTVEKVLHRLAQGRAEDGINLLKRSIQIRAQEVSKRLTQVAKQPRKSRQQPMSGLVEQLIRQNPEVTERQLFKNLKRMLATMEDPPYSHSGESFKSMDKQFHDIKNEAIGDFRHRAKKKLSL